ncbi:phosphoribosylformylglycinamidine synthase subunit PurL [Staphylococcus pasteuri]|uniref:Phosphoribosylformylglycinamidine synthase subunit PurL n=2 Tax=Staphylococcus TaxID=1279 RepID=A0ABY1H110_9STAP|nr:MULTISPECIES: phosphoribosylformylglycinamidine synthase subunit PurL [Staphylococcus]ATH62965.1 phosphoribosylformylglycinamidine synthase II [Staphylococcus pasteuri]KKI57019.1 Phosphoribosylformylglycinamidine synthase, synthetase subunit [Staphylococcus pasteuri]MBM6506981.1 phosphoribosylformylglycinamidine synthase subunit PurL [Staphylococcus pasteuri]MCD9065774.1 phosphoribosylformylglycinamidine synthase subunit PurL [Staphylococcus pasteuri]MCO0860274.1 phosphoribosylformylglycina
MSKFIEPSIEEIKLEKLYQDMGLSDKEYDKVCEILGREPNFTETGIFSVMWSEHCSYKHSKPFLKQFPTSGEHVLMGPGEGAGVVDIGDKQAVVFKVESHNHPSAIEPYQGAATGVGGIIRDIVSIGARPINLLNSLRFGELSNKQNQRLLKGVVSGIGGYGNCIGIPTTAGEIEFDDRYDGNPLVNAMCVGIIDHDMVQKGTAKGVGNSVIYVGLKTGRDGIHGATFASEELTEESESKRPSVQIGDPFVGKKLMEATLEAITFDELVGIQDMGAAGLTSSSSEMAAKGGSGLHLKLDQVPTREPGISPYEMMLSETQERMLLVVEKGTEQKFLDLFEKHELDSAIIGEVTDTDRFVLTYEDEVFADIPVQPLSDEAPVYVLEGEEKEYNTSKNDYSQIDVESTFNQLLNHPTIASKKHLYEQYDQQVGANTIVKPGLQASVVRVEGTNKAIASTIDGEARYVFNQPYEGGKMVVAEAYRNLIAVGATPLAMTDCLNYGSPEKKEIYQQLIDSTKGMAEACDVLNTPVVSGNVSLYNETRGTSIFPTPVVGMVGLIENIDYLTDFKPQAGDKLYLVGETRNDFGGSQLEKLIYGSVNHEFESIDLSKEVEKGEAIKEAIRNGIASHVQTVGKGGLLITLAKMSAYYDLGLEAHVNVSNPQLFSESQGRYIVAVKANQSLNIDGAIEIGQLTHTNQFNVSNEQTKITKEVTDIKHVWEGAIHQCLTTQD